MNTKAIVMSRVRAIHALRPLISSTTLAVFLFVFALAGIGKEVWVAKIIENMPSVANVSAFVNFFLSAFMSTTFMVQALSVIVLAALIYIARETAKLLVPTPQQASLLSASAIR